MSRYLPFTGQVTNIAELSIRQPSSCSLLFTLQGMNEEVNQFTISPDAFVYDQEEIRVGDRITVFYDSLAPVPLIYPPRYQAAAVAKTPVGRSAALDVFDENLVNTNHTLRLNLASSTQIRTQNGQLYPGRLPGQLLLVLYSWTTRSIPAQTTPETVVVFCEGEA